MQRNGVKYRDDGIGDHVLRRVRIPYTHAKEPSSKDAHLVSVLRARRLGLRGGGGGGSSALGLGLGLLGRHGD